MIFRFLVLTPKTKCLRFKPDGLIKNTRKMPVYIESSSYASPMAHHLSPGSPAPLSGNMVPARHLWGRICAEQLPKVRTHVPDRSKESSVKVNLGNVIVCIW